MSPRSVGAAGVTWPISVAGLYPKTRTAGGRGLGARWSRAALWERARRQGVGCDGRSRPCLRSHEFYALSDADRGALIADLRSRRTVDRTLGGQSVGRIG